MFIVSDLVDWCHHLMISPSKFRMQNEWEQKKRVKKNAWNWIDLGPFNQEICFVKVFPLKRKEEKNLSSSFILSCLLWNQLEISNGHSMFHPFLLSVLWKRSDEFRTIANGLDFWWMENEWKGDDRRKEARCLYFLNILNDRKRVSTCTFSVICWSQLVTMFSSAHTIWPYVVCLILNGKSYHSLVFLLLNLYFKKFVREKTLFKRIYLC